MATILSLLIPGLLGTWPDDLIAPRPTVPALEWLLARADRHKTLPAIDAVLFQLFGLSIPVEADLPVAAVTQLADSRESGDDWWLRADPVHLRPDLRGVFLADARTLTIEPVEAAALAAAFDQTFASDGLQLHVPCPDRWYLRLPADPGIRTHPLCSVIGRDINSLLPYGPNTRRWHALLTEAQMLFHNHPVNQAREQCNQPMINSVWFWGGGSLPIGAHLPVAGLYARDPLLRGLAWLADGAISPVPDNASDWQEAAAGETSSLVMLDLMRYDRIDGNPLAWAEHVAYLEQNWFKPCRRLLQIGQIKTLHLYGGDGYRYSLTGAARWRFWRRIRSVNESNG
ncbi:MAG TPA: hypothetical protein P5149_00350 [Candidatus Competibacteraceae bacterium]|nr:hypothetical protein [Candidatus Competibacteraceae bacterium]MCP5132067.1 hypothetical protein [Gammaproteobacteria bacterium]HRY16827.1 hypothetical protein [Candidatus Competibacteraceae bacterium]